MGGTILISGGSGFLAVAVAEHLLAQEPGRRVILASRTKGSRLARLGVPDRVRRGGPRRPRGVSGPGAGRGSGRVFHLASLVSGGAEADFVAGMQANLYASLNLLEACRLAGSRPRFVFPQLHRRLRRVPAAGDGDGLEPTSTRRTATVWPRSSWSSS